MLHASKIVIRLKYFESVSFVRHILFKCIAELFNCQHWIDLNNLNVLKVCTVLLYYLGKGKYQIGTRQMLNIK